MRATVLSLLSLVLLTPAAISQSAPEKALVDLTNQTRAENHLPPLTWDPALARAARQHLAVVLQHPGTLEHQYPGEPDLAARGGQAGAHFSSISENLAGNAQTPAQIHESWMNSPHHRENILDPRLTAIGIAVAQTPNGLLAAVQDFGQSAAAISNDAIEQQVQKLLAQQGIKPNNSAQAKHDARESCASGEITLSDPRPILTMQWECTDLSQLPAELAQHLPPSDPQHPRTAAVGSCPAKQTGQGFTTYRIGVLIY
jgi:Cysteine-rich secretory protein family